MNHGLPRNGFYEVHAKNAEDFLQLITPFGEALAFNADIDGPWLFRGHGNADWELLPAVFRPERAMRLLKVCGGSIDARKVDHDLVSIYLESEVLRRFIERCNVAGLALPLDLDAFRLRCQQVTATSLHLYSKTLDIRIGDPPRPSQEDVALEERERQLLDWPASDMLGCLSLAQHFGIPTRLLDFSASPWHAAYFAAAGSIEHRTKAFSVICLRSRLTAAMMSRLSNFRTLLSTPPRSGNANVAAQKGRFLYVKHADPVSSKNITVDRISQRRKPAFSLERAYHDVKVSEKAPVFGVKVICGQPFAERVLRLLASVEITRSTAFPSYDSVAMEVMDGGFSDF